VITIDGAFGEGGGQILRTALGLSLVTQSPFTIKNVRAGRKKPGLLHQHLTAVKAAVQISNANVEGDFFGSQQLFFNPKRVYAGDYTFAVGTAGSATLVFQTILPALLIAENISQVTVKGGTHNPFAPPFDFLQKVFFPLITHMGTKIKASIKRYGFYPAGGGEINFQINPTSKLTPLNINERGELLKRSAYALYSKIPSEIAADEINTIKERLSLTKDECNICEVPSPGPGNVVLIEYQYENICEVFSGFGQPGTSRFEVAKKAIAGLQKYFKTNAPVGSCLADQLLIPFAMAGGGEFCTGGLTKHAITNMDIIRKFLNVEFSVTPKKHGVISINARV